MEPEVIVLILACVSLANLALSTVQVWRLATWVKDSGIGRIAFWSLATLKLWAAFILLDFIIAAFAPAFVNTHRDAIRLFLAVYLVAQPITVNVALIRWRYSGHPEAQGGDTSQANVLQVQDADAAHPATGE